MTSRFSGKLAAASVLSLTLGITQPVLAADVGGVLWRGATYATLAGLAYTNAFRADSFRLAFGAYPDHDAVQIEANLRYDLSDAHDITQNISITPFLDVSYSSWQFVKGDGFSMTNKGNAFGIAPGFRFEWPSVLRVIDFVDVRAGVSLLAPTQLENKDGSVRDFGGNFTFSEQFAIGGYFSDAKTWEWQLGVQHHSNHNIYEKNNGIEFYNLTFGYNY